MKKKVGGWVRLYREITSTDLWQDPDLMRVWTWILLNTVWDSDKAVTLQGTTVPPGHVLGSYRHISRQTSYLRNNQRIFFPPGKVGRMLKRLEDQGRITLEATPSGQLIKVVNWDRYNAPEGAEETPVVRVQEHTAKLWDIWVEAFCKRKPFPTLNDERARCLNLLYTEQLEKLGNGDYLNFFRSILNAVKASEFHMSKREYVYPESLFRNESRREKWTLEGVHGKQVHTTTGNFVARTIWRPE